MIREFVHVSTRDGQLTPISMSAGLANEIRPLQRRLLPHLKHIRPDSTPHQRIPDAREEDILRSLRRCKLHSIWKPRTCWVVMDSEPRTVSSPLSPRRLRSISHLCITRTEFSPFLFTYISSGGDDLHLENLSGLVAILKYFLNQI